MCSGMSQKQVQVCLRTMLFKPMTKSILINPFHAIYSEQMVNKHVGKWEESGIERAKIILTIEI